MTAFAHLTAETREYKKLRVQLHDEFPNLDDETTSDTLEGISSLPDTIAAIIRSALEDEALAKGLKSRLEELKDRLGRFQRRAVKKRELALDALINANIKKLMQPDFTISVRPGALSIAVTSEDEIPDMYWIPQEPKLDRQNMLAALKSGDEVPGATLRNPKLTLSVRTK